MLADGPARVVTAGTLFDEQERSALTAALAATGGTAELLGRARVRERQSQALARGGPQTFAEPAFAFADDPAAGLKPLAPEAAVKHFRALVPQLGVDPERFGVEQRRRAFTVAQATEQSLLGRLKDLILRSLEGTATPQPWGEQAVRDLLDQAGVTPRNPQYAEMVFRTNMMDAYTQGATDELQDPDVAETFPVWRYDGIDDHRAGDDHRPKFGRYYPNAVAFAVVRGQRVYNCRCVPTPIDRWTWEQLQREGARVETSWFASEADGFASFYHGPQPPGPGWTLAHEGPRGGKVWQRADTEKKPGLVDRLLGRKPKPDSADDNQAGETTGRVLADRIAKSKEHKALGEAIEQTVGRSYDSLARDAGLAPQEFRQQVAAKAQKIVDSCDVYMRVADGDILEKILTSGRFKNQHEAGRSSGAIFDPPKRKMIESASMGVGADIVPESRPMYGYLSEKGFGFPPGADMAHKYGAITIQFRPQVKDRSTVSFGDSWSLASNKEAQASPAGAVGHQSVSPIYLQNAGGLAALDNYRSWAGAKMPYIEAHVHDGLDASDIAEIRFPKGFVVSPKLEALLKKRGIAWSNY